MLYDHLAEEVVKYMPYPPTANQAELIEAMCYYMTGKSSDIFILNGYAGTGKSTVIAAFTSMLKANNIKSYILAPTGRAAKVVSGYSGRPALTIHKKIYRQKSIAEFNFVMDFNKDRGSYFIVDEASMIGTGSWNENSNFGTGDLLNDLIHYVRSGTDCRLMLIGDIAQLPPVGLSVSAALSPSYMSMFGDVCYFSMTEIIRQAEESGILVNATICRNLIENEDTSFPLFNLDFPDVKAITGSDFIEELETAYYKHGRENTVVITRSNKQAGRFNRGVRDRILYQEEELSSGDLIMIVKNNYAYSNNTEDGESKAKTEESDFIANGDVALVRRVRRYEEVHGFRFAEVTIWLGCDETKELDCKVLLDTISSESPSLSREDSDKLLASVELDYAHIPLKRDRYKAMKTDPYLNALQIKFAYSITCHKSQGGEWSAVFIDRMIFGDEEMTIDMLRWLYTAITRATKELYFINFDERFIGSDF